MSAYLDKHVLVIDVLDNEVVAMVIVDLDQDCFDRRVAFHQDAFMGLVYVIKLVQSC